MYNYLELKPKNIRDYTENDSSIKINSFIDFYQNNLAIKFNILDSFVTTYSRYYPIITKYGEEDSFGTTPGSEVAYNDFTIIEPTTGYQWDYRDVVVNKRFVLENNKDYYIVYNGFTKPYILNGFNLIVVGMNNTLQLNYYYSNMISIPIPDNMKVGQPPKITNIVYNENSRSVSFDLPNVLPSDPIITYTISRIISLGNKVSQIVDATKLRVVNSRVGPIFLQDLDQIWKFGTGSYTYEIIANNSSNSEPAYFSFTINPGSTPMIGSTFFPGDPGSAMVDSWKIIKAIDEYNEFKDPYEGIDTNGSPGANLTSQRPTFEYLINPPKFFWRVIPPQNIYQDSELELTIYPDPNMLTPATPIGPNDYSRYGYYNILPGWPGGEARPSITCPTCPQLDNKKSLKSIGQALDLNTNRFVKDVLHGILPSGVVTLTKGINLGSASFYKNSKSISLTETLPQINQTIPFVKRFNRHEISDLAIPLGSGRFDIRASYGAIYQFTSTERYEEYGCPSVNCVNKLSTGKFFDRRFANKVIRSVEQKLLDRRILILELPYAKNADGSINKDIFESTFRVYGKFIVGNNSISVSDPSAQKIVDGTTDTSNNCVNCLGYNNFNLPVIMDLGAVMPISGVEIRGTRTSSVWFSSINTTESWTHPISGSLNARSPFFDKSFSTANNIISVKNLTTTTFTPSNFPQNDPHMEYNSNFVYFMDATRNFLECRYIYVNGGSLITKFKPLF